ncbi:helix-turn-helix domain-containing protein [Salmonella enterica]|uniref:Transcriptional regulator n=1 Tax=Salmonella enterica subsp. enterica serovar Kottbus TaxID=224727 RepID=A0A5J0SCD1_SALET|nr:transcriptional regulator [Salmonella enterica]EBO8543540.1 transcriptional regulator [Salmonella enterica subsp. enterica serovar Senftenberg]EBQ9797685.1 transcriptional regulator [Salmonella enterica subsp. enterica serovar Kottbus]EBX0321759.1 transcriptional regulator [Salmonella enterica subsp. enterica serovar Oranienburg]EBZ5051486.1 transcriptional regulator [Salmonella enterica subsp. enterica serovar Poona]ECD2011070.1 transcriptional regulator [Salmonella enterica subsp. enteric
MSTRINPKKAQMDMHRADIVAEIRKRGWSLRRLSLSMGMSAGYLKNALDRPWPKGERIIADVIGSTPEKIWPSRYNL